MSQLNINVGHNFCIRSQYAKAQIKITTYKLCLIKYNFCIRSQYVKAQIKITTYKLCLIKHNFCIRSQYVNEQIKMTTYKLCLIKLILLQWKKETFLRNKKRIEKKLFF
jgi:hypothetical protein